MKSILCFGDSNTWGYNPLTGGRHDYDNRWTTVLARELGEEFIVIPEGLNGRTTVWDDPVEGDKNGKTHLVPLLESHMPLDLVILFLGTNDLKCRFSLTAWDIASGAGALVDMIKQSGCGPQQKAPEVLVLIPPPVQRLTGFADMFAGAPRKSRELQQYFAAMAGEKGVRSVNTGDYVRLSDADGIHFEPAGQRDLGSLVAREVKSLLF